MEHLPFVSPPHRITTNLPFFSSVVTWSLTLQHGGQWEISLASFGCGMVLDVQGEMEIMGTTGSESPGAFLEDTSLASSLGFLHIYPQHKKV